MVDKFKGKNKDVYKMYSNVAPYPGRFIRLMSEKNKLKKKIYTSIAKTKMFNQKKGYEFSKYVFQKYCPPPESKTTILDAGCGTGEKALRFAYAFPHAQVTGIDFSDGSIDYARKLQSYFNVTNVRFIKKNLASDSLEDIGTFDYIHCAGVLHHIDSPITGLKNLTTVMTTDTYLWIFLYADYGKKHLENTRRKGIKLLFEDDSSLKERVDFVKDLGITSRYSHYQEEMKVKAMSRKLYKTAKMVKNLWFEEYTLQTRAGDVDLYDAFAHPIAAFYTYESVRELIESADLELVQYVLGVQNKRYEKKLRPYLKGKNIYDAMRVAECFYYPDNYKLILKLKSMKRPVKLTF